ncbi:MAG: response regulator [Bacteroidetes bacterium]|nr:response regulator [Bacteroidota bacterium]
MYIAMAIPWIRFRVRMNLLEMNYYRKTVGRSVELFLLCLLLILISISGIAQEEIIRYSINEGLSSNAVYTMEMDHEGYLWVGTYHGLNRFDGREFKQYFFGEIASRKVDRVTDIYLDSKDRLWVSTSGGLYLYNKVEDSFIKVTPGKLKIGEIAEDSSGTIWVVGYGAFILDESTLTLREVQIVDCGNQMIEDILFDPHGDIWLGWYRGGITQCAYDKIREPDKLHIKRSFSPATEGKMKSDVVRELLLDDQGRLVFTTYLGLNWIDLNRDENNLSVEGFSNELSDARYWSVIQDHQGNIWAGTYGDGLFKLNSDLGSPVLSAYKTNINSPGSISCNEIHSIFEDRYQNIWIGTENGLNRIVKNEITYFTYQNNPVDRSSIASNHVFEIYQDTTGKIWIGTPRGLSVFDYNMNNGQFDNFQLPGLESEDNFIYSIFPGNEMYQFYIGTLGGLYVYELGGSVQKIEGIEHRVRSKVTIQDIVRSDSLIWVATDDGVYAYDSLMDKPVYYFDFGQQPLDCRKMLYGKDGSIWLATDNGLKRIIDPEAGNEGNNIRNYPLRIEHGNNFNNDITDIIEDEDLNKWIGTGSGLYYYNETTRDYLEFNSKNGLLEDYVSGLLVYEDRIIVVGLSTLALINSKDHSIESYSFGAVINNYKDPLYSTVLFDGNIAIGGVNGLKIMNPEDFRKDSTHYPLKIHDFRIANKSVRPAINRKRDEFRRISVAKKIYLDSKSNTFTLDFSSLNFSGADIFTYKYKLDSYDENWLYVNSDRGFANYSKLKPGSYLFRVNATNSIGHWNLQDTTLEIVVLPPIWRSWYFILGYLILLTIFLIFVKNELSIRYKLSTEKKLSKEIKKKNEEQLKFFINISHELKTPLSMIQGPLDYLNKNLNRTNELYKHSEWALNNAYRLTSIVNEILDFRLLEAEKLEPSMASVDWEKFIEVTFGYFIHVADQKVIHYSLNNDINSIVSIDKSMMEKAIVSMLDNAFKYTPNHGEVSLSAAVEKSYFDYGTDGIHIICSNTGSFIPAGETDKIFERFYRTGDNSEEGSGIGLSITRQFIELHQGKIWCVSSEETGVEFHSVIPLIEANQYKPTAENKTYSDDYRRIYGAGPMEFAPPETKPDGPDEAKPRLLLVEDNNDLRNFMASALNDHYVVMLASNGAEALEVVEKEVHPEVIISDIMMPVMNGLELCNKIKNSISMSHIPIVLLTAQTEQYSQLDSFNHEANAYLEKPFNIELLSSCISSILKQKEVLKKYYSSVLFDSYRIEEDDPNTSFIDHLKQIILNHIDNSELSIDTLCEEMSISQYMLYNKIKSITGKTPGQIIKKIRIQNAEALIGKNQYSIKEVQYMTGFNNPKSFRDAFMEEFGVLPSEYSV